MIFTIKIYWAIFYHKIALANDFYYKNALANDFSIKIYWPMIFKTEILLAMFITKIDCKFT